MSIAQDIDEFDCLFKIVMIGKSFVGKSKILQRYLKGQYDDQSKSTVGVQFMTKILSIDQSKIKVQIWDTLGSQRFKSISKVYFRGAVGAVLVYDISDQSSFIQLNNWLKILQQNINRNEIVIMLVGNKCDIVQERVINIEQGMQFAQKNGLGFYQTSAKEGKNINTMFTKLIEQIFKQMVKASILKSILPQNKASTLQYPIKKNTKNNNKCC